jgi:hypothetical protein
MAKRKAKPKPIPEVDPIAFARLARAFYKVAEGSSVDGTLSKPLYFLYFHALELAFKAFLRLHHVPTGELQKKDKGHTITVLYEDCRRLGLVIGPGDKFDIGNIVNMLQAANEYQGLRYFNPDLKSLPTLAWTRETVGELITTLEARLGIVAAATPGPAKSLIFVWGKPEPQR